MVRLADIPTKPSELRQPDVPVLKVKVEAQSEMRSERHSLIHCKLEERGNRPARKGKVQGVARVNGSLLAANDFSSGFLSDVRTSELVNINIKVASCDPVGETLDEREELCQDADIRLRVEPDSSLEVD